MKLAKYLQYDGNKANIRGRDRIEIVQLAQPKKGRDEKDGPKNNQLVWIDRAGSPDFLYCGGNHFSQDVSGL